MIPTALQDTVRSAAGEKCAVYDCHTALKSRRVLCQAQQAVTASEEIVKTCCSHATPRPGERLMVSAIALMQAEAVTPISRSNSRERSTSMKVLLKLPSWLGHVLSDHRVCPNHTTLEQGSHDPATEKGYTFHVSDMQHPAIHGNPFGESW